MNTGNPEPITELQAQRAAQLLSPLVDSLNQALFGQETLIERVVIALLARGHVLLEGLPGLGKTELVKGISKAIDLQYRRVQFTPDLLPGDITGNPVLQEDEKGRRHFVFQKGPLFTQLLLADEINRASPKTQSALLEAMQERSVTVFGETHVLPEPFFVFATQNPIELEGTYPLPEAQVDRFLFKLDVLRSSSSVIEKIIQTRDLGQEIEIKRSMQVEELRELIQLARKVYLPPSVTNFIARLVEASQPGQSQSSAGVKFGASPRAAISLAAASRSRALLNGRVNASFEDVQSLAVAVLQHRIIVDYQAKVEGKTGTIVVEDLLQEITPEGIELPKSIRSAKI